MKAKVKSFEVDVTPMTKYEFYEQVKKIPVQHRSNKWIDGFYCNWNGYTFWLCKEDFDKLYKIENE